MEQPDFEVNYYAFFLDKRKVIDTLDMSSWEIEVRDGVMFVRDNIKGELDEVVDELQEAFRAYINKSVEEILLK